MFLPFPLSWMRKRTKPWVVIVCCIVGSATSLMVFMWIADWIEGPAGRFWRIRQGMKDAEVYEILGPPHEIRQTLLRKAFIDKNEKDETLDVTGSRAYWHFGNITCSVIFDPNGSVVQADRSEYLAQKEDGDFWKRVRKYFGL
ncbi:MAG TPA: hypothetical protein VE988_27750 [Gemmataceae bacterium]|nr:hypothetical protein [Gemmataceae bacterium]